MFFYWPKMLGPFCLLQFYASLLLFYLSLLSVGWYCGAGVFGLIGCKSFSSSLELPIFLNNNNIDINNLSPSFSLGVQGPQHPNPGRSYRLIGFPRVTYLPDTTHGRKVGHSIPAVSIKLTVSTYKIT